MDACKMTIRPHALNEWLHPTDLPVSIYCFPFVSQWKIEYGAEWQIESTTREIFFCSLRKTFGRVSDTSKKAERTSAVSPEHYTPNKVFVSPRSCPWIRFALHQRTRSRPPLAGEQPRQYFLSDCLLRRSESAIDSSGSRRHASPFRGS